MKIDSTTYFLVAMIALLALPTVVNWILDVAIFFATLDMRLKTLYLRWKFYRVNKKVERMIRRG